MNGCRWRRTSGTQIVGPGALCDEAGEGRSAKITVETARVALAAGMRCFFLRAIAPHKVRSTLSAVYATRA